jgi:hypothetical protein
MEMELLSLLTFFIGLFVGNRFAIGRDKRKEFNQATSPIYYKLKDFLKHNEVHYIPPISELENVEEYFSIWTRRKYTSLVTKLKEANERLEKPTYDPSSGQVGPTDSSHLSDQINIVSSLLNCLARK